MKAKFLNPVLALFISIALFGCLGKKSPSNDEVSSTAANSCPAGQNNSAYGCLSQGSCPAGSGYYNGQCVPLYNNSYNNNYNNGYNNPSNCQGACPIGYVNLNSQCIPQGRCQAACTFELYGSCQSAIGYGNNNGGYNYGYGYSNGSYPIRQ